MELTRDRRWWLSTMMDAAKNVIRLIYGCQYRRVLSVSSNVMSIRRTDKHCGARLVAAPATLHISPLLFSSLLYPAFRLPTLPSAFLPLALSPSTPIPLCLRTRLCAATYNHSTPPPPPYLPPIYRSIYSTNTTTTTTAIATTTGSRRFCSRTR